MFSLLNKIRFIVAFVFFILMIQSSASSPLENDTLAQLIERLDKMQTKMDAMRSREVENAQLTERLDRMQTKMDSMHSREEVLEVENAKLTERLDGMKTQMDAIRSRMEVENDKWTRKFGELEAENEKLKSQISHPKVSLSPRKRDDRQSSIISSSPPTSCEELKDQNGKIWPIDGIHLLRKQNKIKAAFCTFPADGSPVSEALIGQVDVKTNSVHFFVQRNAPFNTKYAVIPFDVAKLNEGGAFNLTSGIFTASVPGIYHFDFSGGKSTSATYVDIVLQLNGDLVGRTSTQQSDVGSEDVVSLSASLRLAAGDRVNLFNFGEGGMLYDGTRSTQFIGWLVEEDLMQH